MASYYQTVITKHTEQKVDFSGLSWSDVPAPFHTIRNWYYLDGVYCSNHQELEASFHHYLSLFGKGLAIAGQITTDEGLFGSKYAYIYHPEHPIWDMRITVKFPAIEAIRG